MFLRQMTDAFFVRTEPDSSMVNPAHIHITRAPQTRNEKLFRTNCDSASRAACAWVGVRKRSTMAAAAPGPAADRHRTPERELVPLKSVWITS